MSLGRKLDEKRRALDEERKRIEAVSAHSLQLCVSDVRQMKQSPQMGRLGSARTSDHHMNHEV